jgi:hypothetical protein
MYVFSITKLVCKFPVSRFPGFRKPGNLLKCLKTWKLNGHLPDETADVLTKALPRPKHNQHITEMGMSNAPT